MSKVLNLQSMAYNPTHAAAGNSNNSNTCQGNSCISIFCGRKEIELSPAEG